MRSFHANLVAAFFTGLGVITVIAGASCGGQATAPATDGGASSTVDGGIGNDGGYTIGCPSTPPWTRTTANGPKSPCSKEGQICEYGNDFNPGCNTVVRCDGGEWAIPLSFGTSAKCGSPPPIVPPNPSDCPSSRAAITDGQSCAVKSTCQYDGASCWCGTYCPQYPVGQVNCDPDAGITENCCDRSKPPTWNCFGGARYCPSPRPHLGDPCTTEGEECALSPPGECGQAMLRCSQGTWGSPMNAGCPVSTARAKEDIVYADGAQTARLRDELLDVRLATYRYKSGDPSRHLGFIIEDQPDGSPAVLASRDRVDLYGYVSMTVAAIQEQQKQIDSLTSELARVRKECRPNRQEGR